MNKIIPVTLGLIAGLAGSLIPLSIGPIASLVAVSAWGAWCFIKVRSLIPLGTMLITTCIVMVVAALLPVKYLDKTVTPAFVDVTKLKNFDLVYENQDTYLMFIFPEDKWDMEITLPKEDVTVRELIKHVERVTGLRYSGMRACSFTFCNILFGCPGDWVMFASSDKQG